MLIREIDGPLDEDEWRSFVEDNAFGHLVAAGAGRDVPVVVPTQFVLDRNEVVLHLARPNPIWVAIDENPTVVLSVAGDWAYIPSSWKAIGDENPRYGIPTTYYAAVQLIGTAEIVDDAMAVATILRSQLAAVQPSIDAADPLVHTAHLQGIRGLRVSVTEVRAKFKFGANVDTAHRKAVHQSLLDRNGPGDLPAARHLEKRLDLP